MSNESTTEVLFFTLGVILCVLIFFVFFSSFVFFCTDIYKSLQKNVG